jgi:hypothetical protein
MPCTVVDPLSIVYTTNIDAEQQGTGGLMMDIETAG